MDRLGNVGAMTSWVVPKKDLLLRILRRRNERLLRGGASITDCQRRIDEEIDGGRRWLQLEHVLQNLRGEGIATLLGRIRSDRVVVKVQPRAAAEREMAVQSQLADVEGFARFHCLFECDGGPGYVETFGTVGEVMRDRVCSSKGDALGIIVMPYHAGGSLEDVLRNGRYDERDVKDAIAVVVRALYEAYRRKRFTHGDTFTKNVVLDDRGRPILIDFEHSAFEGSLVQFWRDLDNLLGDVGRYWQDKTSTLDAITRVMIVHRAYEHAPDERVISDIIEAVRRC